MSTPFALSVGDSLQQGFDAFFAFLPNLIGFLVILIVGYIIARVIKGVVTKLLQKVGVDRTLHQSQAGQYVERVSPGASPAAFIGSIVFWFIFIFVLSAAIGALKIPALTQFMNQVLAYLPNVIVAVLIFVIAAAIAGGIAGLVAKVMGDTPTGKVVATVAPALVMVIAVFMILNQLKIAPEIVQITFTAILFAFAAALALAFGLGGRDVAARMLEEAYDRGRQQKEQVKEDARLAKERGREQAERGKQRAQAEVEGGGAQTQVQPGPGSTQPGSSPAGGGPQYR